MVMVMVDIASKEEPSILRDRGNSRNFRGWIGNRNIYLFINKNMWWEQRERRILYFGLHRRPWKSPQAFLILLLLVFICSDKINGDLYWPWKFINYPNCHWVHFPSLLLSFGCWDGVERDLWDRFRYCFGVNYKYSPCSLKKMSN